MKKPQSIPTMMDVAREAGVAIGTVSKVVNGRKVAEPYRVRVENAIEKLGYQLNKNGRALRTNQTNTVALIIPNSTNPYFAQLVHHIDLALAQRNYSMLLCFSEYRPRKEPELIRMVRQNRVDGIIALTYTPDLDIPDGIPFITIDRFFSVSVPCVASDNFAGGRLAAQKLYEFGCRNVAFIRFGSSLTNEPSKRKDGFVSACLELGMTFDTLLMTEDKDFRDVQSYLYGHMHDGRLDYDGLFLGTDMLAWQTIQFLRDHGIRIPKDVQVIGFDGIRAFGSLEYMVSTIVQPVKEIAETCVSMLFSPDRHSIPSLVCLPVRYQYGGTTQDPDLDENN